MAIINREAMKAKAQGNAAYYAQHLESLMRWAARTGHGRVYMSMDTAECIAATLRAFLPAAIPAPDRREQP